MITLLLTNFGMWGKCDCPYITYMYGHAYPQSPSLNCSITEHASAPVAVKYVVLDLTCSDILNLLWNIFFVKRSRTRREWKCCARFTKKDVPKKV